jgi:hypothetical protein
VSQRGAAVRLKVSEPLLYKIFKNRSDIETSALTNENTDRKRARSGKESQVESALKIRFSTVHEKNTSINGSLIRQTTGNTTYVFKINVVFYTCKRL